MVHVAMNRRTWLAGFLLFGGVACSEQADPVGPQQTDATQTLQREPAKQQQQQQQQQEQTPPPQSAAFTLVAERGSGQTLAPGETLRELLVVQALDSAGRPVAGVPVEWSTPDGGSIYVYLHARVTGVDGRAVGLWTLGPAAGTQTAVATAGGQRATFTAEAVPGATPPVAAIVIGLGQTWLEPGESSYLRAAAIDAAGLIVKSATFTWTTDRPGIVTLKEVPLSPGVSRLEFTALAPGDVYITGRAGGQTKTILVRVFPPGGRPTGGQGCGGCG